MHRELHSLVIPEVFKEDGGNFMVRATNIAGEAKCYASLSIKAGQESHIVKVNMHTFIESYIVKLAHNGSLSR